MSAIASLSSETNVSLADTVPSSTGVLLSDHDLSTANETTVSFGDFLDMVNPLQHIPVLSAAYRAVTGDSISPQARIAGDALYGGLMGLASAGLSAVAALGDEVYAANNDGQSMGASVVAGLFGNETTATSEPTTDAPNNPVLVAEAQQTTPQTPVEPSTATTDTAPVLQATNIQTALWQTPAKQSPILNTSLASTPSTQTASATPPISTSPVSTSPAASAPPQLTAAQLTAARPTPEQIAAAQTALSPNLAAAAQAASATSDPALGLALNRSKAAYGGVMDTSMMQNAMQNQTLALALANSKNTMQGEHAVRNSRFAAVPNTVPNVLPPATSTAATSAATASPPRPSATPTASATPPTSPTTALNTTTAQAPIQATLDQLQAMRSLSRYRSTAQSLPVTGTSLDVVN